MAQKFLIYFHQISGESVFQQKVIIEIQLVAASMSIFCLRCNAFGDDTSVPILEYKVRVCLFQLSETNSTMMQINFSFWMNLVIPALSPKNANSKVREKCNNILYNLLSPIPFPKRT